jgi:SNF2 family DNA or RNA helicase
MHFVDIPMVEYDSMVSTYTCGDVLAGNAGVAIGKLLQICNGAIYKEDGLVLDIHDIKIDKLEDLIEASNENNVLIFYQYRFDILKIKKRLPDAVELKSQESIRQWCMGDTRVAYAHAASVGHGLNLQTGGNIIVWYGVPWSLELYSQANARLHRQGQENTVYIHHILARGTIDEKVMASLTGKHLTQEELLKNLLAERNKP